MKKVKVIKERHCNKKMHVFKSERIEYKYNLYTMTIQGVYKVCLETNSPYEVFAKYTHMRKHSIPCYVLNTITGKKIIEYKKINKTNNTPISICTLDEYTTEIKPILNELNEINICPLNRVKSKMIVNCNKFNSCKECPFGKADIKIKEAIEVIKDIKIEEF